MKKLSLALVMVLAVALLALSAAAAAPVDFEVAKDGSFDVTYEGTAGAYYAIVAVKGISEVGTAPSITEDSIQFIDQKTAGADGKVTFSDILLKVDGTEASIYLGGSDLNAAILLGYVNKSAGFEITGTITSSSAVESTVSFIGSGNTYSVDTVNGVYTISVPAGTYTFKATKKYSLSVTVNEFVVSEADTVDCVLYGGDTDENGKINVQDLNSLLSNYGMTGATTATPSNINGDSTVNVQDLNILLSHYGMESHVISFGDIDNGWPFVNRIAGRPAHRSSGGGSGGGGGHAVPVIPVN